MTRTHWHLADLNIVRRFMGHMAGCECSDPDGRWMTALETDLTVNGSLLVRVGRPEHT